MRPIGGWPGGEDGGAVEDRADGQGDQVWAEVGGGGQVIGRAEGDAHLDITPLRKETVSPKFLSEGNNLPNTKQNGLLNISKRGKSDCSPFLLCM